MLVQIANLENYYFLDKFKVCFLLKIVANIFQTVAKILRQSCQHCYMCVRGTFGVIWFFLNFFFVFFSLFELNSREFWNKKKVSGNGLLGGQKIFRRIVLWQFSFVRFILSDFERNFFVLRWRCSGTVVETTFFVSRGNIQGKTMFRFFFGLRSFIEMNSSFSEILFDFFGVFYDRAISHKKLNYITR